MTQVNMTLGMARSTAHAPRLQSYADLKEVLAAFREAFPKHQGARNRQYCDSNPVNNRWPVPGRQIEIPKSHPAMDFVDGSVTMSPVSPEDEPVLHPSPARAGPIGGHLSRRSSSYSAGFDQTATPPSSITSPDVTSPSAHLEFLFREIRPEMIKPTSVGPGEHYSLFSQEIIH